MANLVGACELALRSSVPSLGWVWPKMLYLVGISIACHRERSSREKYPHWCSEVRLYNVALIRKGPLGACLKPPGNYPRLLKHAAMIDRQPFLSVISVDKIVPVQLN